MVVAPYKSFFVFILLSPFVNNVKSEVKIVGDIDLVIFLEVLV